VVLVSETLARQFWPNENAVGKHITLSREEVWREVAGVVADVKHYGLDGETRPAIYLPYTQQSINAMSIVVRTSTPPESLAGAIRSELAAMDPDQAIAAMRTLEDLLSKSVARPRLYSALLAIFSTVSLLLAAVGIYGMMSFTVGQRTHEMGVRIALGASPAAVQSMILREGLLYAATGGLLGIAGALALTRVMRNLLFGITATDAATYIGATVLMAIVAAISCLVPARRATRADPMLALRSE
jgi:putative ABC transport system permease protein